MELEKKILEDIINMLDEQEGEKLKKHPKLMAMEVEMKKPNASDEEEAKQEGESLDEEKSEDEMELTPEMIQKLLEMAK